MQKCGPGPEIRVALVFPDLYEMGMSNLGLKVLYDIINKREDAAAERFFSPDLDFEEMLVAKGEPLRSLECKRPLNEFDIVGFTLQYELCYTNVLKIMKLGGIPLYSSQRDGSSPLVIGGGPCAYNPEPLADFFDLFVIGEGEEVMGELLDRYKELKKQGITGKEMLEALAEIDGIYVPSLFSVSYNAGNRISDIRPLKKGYERIRKRVVPDLDTAPYPAAQIVPFTRLIHDRLSIEINRGCTHGCRFCQAGIVSRPVRERSPARIIELLEETVRKTGYEEISLGSLSAGDYSSIGSLLCSVMDVYADSKTSVSFPSLRPDTIHPDIMREVKRVRKTGFTIAPEAGSAKLRNVINKKISDDDIFKAVGYIVSAGWDSLKLYFMIGLPTETDEDLEDIIHLCKKIIRAHKRIKNINVSISSFVPKAHTPFQWTGQRDPDYFIKVRTLLKKRLSGRRITIKFHNARMSFLEGVFARGDRRLGRVLERAVELGCRFDAWSEKFRPDLWTRAFEECAIDPKWYATREMAGEEILPWQHIETGVTREYLRSEFDKAVTGETTVDCRKGECSQCGLPITGCHIQKKGAAGRSYPRHQPGRLPGVRQSYRLRYHKKGDAGYLSHLELANLFHRAFRRSGIPLKYSEGFHPHPKISFGFALAVGAESECEFLDVQIGSFLPPQDLLIRLNSELPDGVKVLQGELLETGFGSISENTAGFRFTVHIASTDVRRIETGLQDSLSQNIILIKRERKGKIKEVDIRPMIGHMNFIHKNGTSIAIDILIRRNGNLMLQPGEVLEGMLQGVISENSVRVEKTEVEWKN